MDIKRNALRHLRASLVVMLAAIPVNSQDSLVDSWNRFARDGNEFAKKVNAGNLDLKLARKLSQEWRAVENSGEWPK